LAQDPAQREPIRRGHGEVLAPVARFHVPGIVLIEDLGTPGFPAAATPLIRIGHESTLAHP